MQFIAKFGHPRGQA